MNFAVRLGLAERFCSWRGSNSDPGWSHHTSERLGEGGGPAPPFDNEINRQLAEFAKAAQLTLVDIGPKMLAPDGTLPEEITSDFCHPTEKGYQIWADSILPLLAAPQ